MSLARWDSLSRQYPGILSKKCGAQVMYDLWTRKPRYKLGNPRDFQAWAETLPGYDSVDLQRLEILIFQDITRRE